MLWWGKVYRGSGSTRRRRVRAFALWSPRAVPTPAWSSAPARRPRRSSRSLRAHRGTRASWPASWGCSAATSSSSTSGRSTTAATSTSRTPTSGSRCACRSPEAPFAARARYMDYLWAAVPRAGQSGDEVGGPLRAPRGLARLGRAGRHRGRRRGDPAPDRVAAGARGGPRGRSRTGRGVSLVGPRASAGAGDRGARGGLQRAGSQRLACAAVGRYDVDRDDQRCARRRWRADAALRPPRDMRSGMLGSRGAGDAIASVDGRRRPSTSRRCGNTSRRRAEAARRQRRARGGGGGGEVLAAGPTRRCPWSQRVPAWGLCGSLYRRYPKTEEGLVAQVRNRPGRRAARCSRKQGPRVLLTWSGAPVLSVGRLVGFMTGACAGARRLADRAGPGGGDVPAPEELGSRRAPGREGRRGGARLDCVQAAGAVVPTSRPRT